MILIFFFFLFFLICGAVQLVYSQLLNLKSKFCNLAPHFAFQMALALLSSCFSIFLSLSTSSFYQASLISILAEIVDFWFSSMWVMLEAIEILYDKSKLSRHMDLIFQEIDELKECFIDIQFNYVHRKANATADWLAKWAQDNQLGICLLEAPPRIWSHFLLGYSLSWIFFFFFF